MKTPASLRYRGVILLSLLTLVASGQEKPLFDYREVTLGNGLRVVTLEDFSCPIVAVQMWYHVGSKDDPPDRGGFAHMFEHMMFRGTDRLGPTDHFDIVHRNGGVCNAYTSFDQTVYVQRLPAHQLELALWLEAERLAFLKVDQESFDTERKVVEEEIRLWWNQPYSHSFRKVLSELFQVHPYGAYPLGQISHLRAAGARELRQFWMRYYVPNNATLVIVGAVKHEQAREQARRYLGWIPRCDEPPRVQLREPVPVRPRSVVIKDKKAPIPIVAIIYRDLGSARGRGRPASDRKGVSRRADQGAQPDAAWDDCWDPHRFQQSQPAGTGGSARRRRLAGQQAAGENAGHQRRRFAAGCA